MLRCYDAGSVRVIAQRVKVLENGRGKRILDEEDVEETDGSGAPVAHAVKVETTEPSSSEPSSSTASAGPVTPATPVTVTKRQRVPTGRAGKATA